MNKVTLPIFLVLLNAVALLATPSRPYSTRHKKNNVVRDVASTTNIVDSSNSLGFKILRRLPKATNVFISPISMSIMMGFVYLGARNHTADEMKRVLGYQNDVHHGYKHILDVVNPADGKKRASENYKLEMANAMLVDKNFNILTNYKDQCRRYYDAAVESVNFAVHPEAAVESVNGWVKWKTKNKITSFLQEPLDSLTKLFLMNAVYFKGTWKTKFDQRLTTPDTFYNDGKVPKTVPMMRVKTKLRYGLDHRVQGRCVELPYSGNDIKMIIFLSEKRDGLSEMESSLSHELLEDISSNLREVVVRVTLPRYTLSEEYDMIPFLKDAGISSIFDPDAVNLSGISPKRGLYITKVSHKSAIDVNEEGSEAASTTRVTAGVRTSSPQFALFTADHPFLFFIRDTRLNLTLFVGRVVNL